jgi:integrase
LFGWAYNPAARAATEPPRDISEALDWAAAASLPVVALADPLTLRRVLDACATTQAGQPAAATTTRRKRAVLHNAIGYAVDAGLLPVNPVDRIRWTAPAVADTIDRRVVANPTQIRALLTAVAAQGRRGHHLHAFFGCLYYAGLRPAEAVALTEADLHLPPTGWGRIDLAASEPKAGRAWTDTHTARDHRGLKHRARTATRTIPIPPELVTLLRNHLDEYGTGPSGRIFHTARGGQLQDTGYGHVWHTARHTALTPTQAASPLARRPYDLRHAAVWRASNIPDSGPYKVCPEMEDGECRNRAGVSLLSSRMKQ